MNIVLELEEVVEGHNIRRLEEVVVAEAVAVAVRGPAEHRSEAVAEEEVGLRQVEAEAEAEEDNGVCKLGYTRSNYTSGARSNTTLGIWRPPPPLAKPPPQASNSPPTHHQHYYYYYYYYYL